MKSKIHNSLLAKRMLLGLGLAVLTLSVANQTQAKSPGTRTGKPIIVAVSLPDHPGKTIKNATELKARLLYLMAHNPKAVKVISKNCGCAVSPQSASGTSFGSCLRACMADVGVSPYGLIMCAAACALAATPPGAIMCAVCVGLNVTVIQVCALGCAMNGGKGFGAMEDTAIKQRHGTSGSWQAKLPPQPAGALL